MEIGDVVSWPADKDGDVSYYGIVRELDGDPPDAAHVMELGAWHRVWGHSTTMRGTYHSVLVSDLGPATSTERGIAKSYSNLKKSRDKAEALYAKERGATA